MTTYLISYDQQAFECNENETLLESALRQGIKLRFSCGKGNCHTCILQCTHGLIPDQAQQGLTQSEIQNQCFLPCCCYPIDHMNIMDLSAQTNQSTLKKASNTARSSNHKPQKNDIEMWMALDQGKKLKIILDDFYQQVYQDKKLSPFFKNSTQKHSSEKQYLFLRQLFTGKKCFLGDRPKNAHHWMVISNELFDYREKILIQCLREHNLPEYLIIRWIDLDESFRKDIVKDVPQPKVMNGITFPLDKFEVLKIDEGTLCDGCHQAIEKNETVRYHIRLGLTYCTHCMNLKTQEHNI